MKEIKLEIPAGCEVGKIEMQDGHIVVTLKEEERKLPKSWEEFCEMSPIKKGECYINEISTIIERDDNLNRLSVCDKACLPDRATAEAVLALCQLIQLRDYYNSDWVPDWKNFREQKFVIDMWEGSVKTSMYDTSMSFLYFKSEELRDEFLRCFSDLIEKLKPLYGIKEGGEQ